MFTSTDPMMQYWNLFSYCGGNPINFVDPTGAKAVDDPSPDYMSDLIILHELSSETYEVLLAAPELLTPEILRLNVEVLAENFGMPSIGNSGIGQYVSGFASSVGDFVLNWSHMVIANTIDADKYFHAKANYFASSKGEGGVRMAQIFSNTREKTDLIRKGGPTSARNADQVANLVGRKGAQLGVKNTYQLLRPKGLSWRY